MKIKVKKTGYMIIKMGKRLNLYLFSENIADLKEYCDEKKGQQIAAYYEDDDGNQYVEYNGKLIRTY